ncbi:competence type IV pilus minor pilin ComGD [Guptibacillus spartinae]|uniref:competence type IV pilus minor pilin ComGD n=1 Tax=Guptibacillus spartinae TaxID=3025679 RepID=UPI002360ED96|nr:competence type IV pilus minor pilin ComGD [Pseudalkalibacillus spartinae]
MKQFHYCLNSLGYTLIEMMMVLSILSLLLTLVFLHITPTQNASSTKHFLEDIQSDLRYTQELAYVNGSSYRFSISPSKGIYSIQSTASSIVKTTKIPKHITIDEGTMGYQIVFGGNGNVQKAGTLYMKTGKEEYKLVVQVGAGRFYIKKL